MTLRKTLTLTLAFCACLETDTEAGNSKVRINEILAGTNGDSGIQFVELAVLDETHKQWGPQGAETAGRCELVFHDAAGNPAGRFVFPHDPPVGAPTVLVATWEFASLTGNTPDFIMPKLVRPIAGKVTFRRNPANGNGEAVAISLSYGGSGYTGAAGPEGLANPANLPIMHVTSLRRSSHFDETGFGSAGQANADFTTGAPTPAGTVAPGSIDDLLQNLAGGPPLSAVASIESQGEVLFSRETFLGNGRTCATCHTPADNFGISPGRIATLPPDDPLFITDHNINTLTLATITSPSDFWLGGKIQGRSGGAATVLAGTGQTYRIIGGASLAIPGNVITDAKGNTATFASFTAGNLNGPTPTNTDTHGLERNTFLKISLALFVENINGITQNSFMRSSPSLFNVKHTAPYGWSGEFPDLQSFSAGAVRQHATRSLNRVAGVDFRDPVPEELDALAAFQNSLNFPANEDYDEDNPAGPFDRFLTTTQQRQGRDAFFGVAKCSMCHGGKALSEITNASLGPIGTNGSFNIGTQLLNTNPSVPTEQDVGQPANSREFSVSSLIGAGRTAPYFHQHAAADLKTAIQFYDKSEFTNSPGGKLVGSIGPGLGGGNLDAIIAFLQVVGVEPQAPAISGAVAQTQTGTVNLSPFPSILVTDPTTPAQTLTVTIQLDDPGKGTLTLSSGFSAAEKPGLYRFNGTAAQATTALRAIGFQYNTSRIRPGGTEMTRFILGVNDGVAATVFDDSSTITFAAPVSASIDPIADLLTLEGIPHPPIPVSIRGLDTTATDFVLNATSNNTALVPNSGLSFGGGGSLRALMVNPAASGTGDTVITLTATQAGKTAQTSFILHVVSFVTTYELENGTPTAGASFSFPAIPGRRYVVEKSTDLVDWDVVSEVIPLTTSGQIDLPPSTEPRHFYRVTLSP